MAPPQPSPPEPQDRQTARAHVLWHSYLTGDLSHLPSEVKLIRQIFKRLPAAPRCKVCNAPFHGLGGAIVNVFGFGAGRSEFNPTLCDRCEKVVKKYQVGLEAQLTLLFADVRGSTPLAEEIGATAFHRLINRYYKTSAEVLTQTSALVNRLIGDGLIGLFVPGLAGPNYARVAVEAARDLLIATGHTDPTGPWIQVGIGVHTGLAYLGAVGDSGGVRDITVLGDTANTAARLSSQAAQGEVLVSEETCRLAQMNLAHCEPRTLQLKGRTEPVTVRALRVAA